jgi:hypothetical protein
MNINYRHKNYIYPKKYYNSYVVLKSMLLNILYCNKKQGDVKRHTKYGSRMKIITQMLEAANKTYQRRVILAIQIQGRVKKEVLQR